jgi:hypothetical protein
MQIPDNSVGWGLGVVGAIVAWLVKRDVNRFDTKSRRHEPAR